MIRIQEAIFVNKAPFGNKIFHFDDSNNIEIFTGINGSGKTTILSYIADAFFEFARVGGFGSFSNESAFYRTVSITTNIDKQSPGLVYLRFVCDGLVRDYCEKAGNVSESFYNDSISLDGKIPFSKIAANDKSVTDGTSLSYGGAFENNLLEYFPAYRFNLPDFLNQELHFRTSKSSFTVDDGFRNRIPNLIEVQSDFKKDIEWLMDIVLDQRVGYADTYDYFFSSNDALNIVLQGKYNQRLRFAIGPRTFGKTRVSVVNDNPMAETIYPSVFQMSSGEIALLSLALEIISSADAIHKKPNQVSGIVLIDEAEEHLHVSLQGKALPQLFRLFPNVQFIVSTHSPLFLLGMEGSKMQFHVTDLDDISSAGENSVFNVEQVKGLLVDIFNKEAKLKESIGFISEISSKANKPIVLGEGKTDIKHFKTAFANLKPQGCDVIFQESNIDGNADLKSALIALSKLPEPQPIIGIFDRDVDEINNWVKKDGSNGIVKLGNNVYAVLLPMTNSGEYGDEKTCVEHLYHTKDLKRNNEHGQRLFLGGEFHKNNESIDGKYCAPNRTKRQHEPSAIIDSDVYLKEDADCLNNKALSKNGFADLMAAEETSKDVDFSCFGQLFAIIAGIISNK